MNYLAHAYFSFGNTDLLTGNMIADYVKGKSALEKLPESIGDGIRLHRRIDAFTDGHPAAVRARVWFRQDYRLYAGPILDCLFDHFLANDPRYFQNDAALKAFSRDTYQKLATQEAWFPAPFGAMFPYMRDHDWLFNYRNLQGMRRSLGGLERRARHMPPADKAYELFIVNYYALNQAYFELIDDLAAFVKRELNPR